MDVQKAIDILLEQNELNEAKAVLDSENEKTSEALLNRVKEILDSGSISDNNECILKLLRLSAIYKVKAFKLYYSLIDEAVLSRDESGISIIKSPELINAIVCSISSLDELIQFKELFFSKKIDDIRRITVFNVIYIYCLSTEGIEELENPELSEIVSQKNNILKDFFSKVINWIGQFYNLANATDEDDRAERHGNMYGMLQQIVMYYFNKEYRDDYEIKNYLFAIIVQILTTSEIDHDNSLFRDYIKLLKLLSPQKYCDTLEIANYIRNIRKTLYKEKIFTASSIEGVGQVLYQKIQDYYECSGNIIKLAIQINRRFPFNSRPKPITIEEYFCEISAYLDIRCVPSSVLAKAEDQYHLVQKELNDLLERINVLEKNCECQIKESEKRSEFIKKKSGKNILTNDTTADRKELLVELQNRKELESLYRKKKTTIDEKDIGADSYLEYLKKCLNETFAFFIDEAKALDEIEETLKQWAIMEVCRESNYDKDDPIFKIESRFAPYFDIIKQINTILDDDPLKTITRIRYRIKSFVFVDEITNKHKKLSGAKLSDQTSIAYKNYINEIENHPLHVDTLLKINEPGEYLKHQKRAVNDAIYRIKINTEQSLCLKKRKRIIDQIISLFKNEEYEAIINIIPIQIEGILADYLENSLIYKFESDLGAYEQIYKSVFIMKAMMVETKGLNLGFETIGYYRYYFNSVFRNTVAHGNYWLLFYSHFKSESISDEQAIAIIAHDLIFDLNYIIDAVATSNEIDEAKRYLKYTAEALGEVASYSEISATDMLDQPYSSDEEKEWHEIAKMDYRYERFYFDLLGESRFNTGKYLKGIFITHEPVQILFWIFNPIIEKAVGDDTCNKIREVILSQEFWKYIVMKLQRGLILNDGHTLDTVINLLMPILKDYQSVSELAVEAKKLIKQIR